MFDPSKYGAVRVDETQTTGKFDPTKYGATLVQEETLAPAETVQPEKKSALGSTLKGVGNFALGVGKSFLETGLRQITNPQSPISPLNKLDPTGQITGQITKAFKAPEKVNLPVFGETSIRYSDNPNTRILQTGEDLLNVLPGAKGTKTATQLAEQGAKGFSGKLIKSAFKVSANDLKKNPTLIKDFLVERIVGSRKSIAKKSEQAVEFFETQLDNVIKEASKTGKRVIDKNNVVKTTEELVKKYENSAFPEMAETVKKKVVDYLKNADNSIESAQEFKKNTYRIIKESGYGKIGSAETETAKQLARGVKEELERVIPDFPVADTNKKIAIYAKAQKLMNDVINKASKNELLPFKDAVIGTGGVMTGDPATSLGLIISRRIIESVPFKTYVANVLTSTKTQSLENLGKNLLPLIKQYVLQKPTQNKNQSPTK